MLPIACEGCWGEREQARLPVAEAAGDATSYWLQQFLYRATWDPDAVRADLRAYVMEQLVIRC